MVTGVTDFRGLSLPVAPIPSGPENDRVARLTVDPRAPSGMLRVSFPIHDRRAFLWVSGGYRHPTLCGSKPQT